MSRKNKRDIDREIIIKDIKRAQLDVKTAESFFEWAIDPELIDVAIYDLEAKKSRYAYLIRSAKEKGIRASIKESLVESMAK